MTFNIDSMSGIVYLLRRLDRTLSSIPLIPLIHSGDSLKIGSMQLENIKAAVNRLMPLTLDGDRLLIVNGYLRKYMTDNGITDANIAEMVEAAKNAIQKIIQEGRGVQLYNESSEHPFIVQTTFMQLLYSEVGKMFMTFINAIHYPSNDDMERNKHIPNMGRISAGPSDSQMTEINIRDMIITESAKHTRGFTIEIIHASWLTIRR